VTAPRIIVPGATIALTRRCTLRKAFLAPWHPLVSKVWLYAMADAQRHTGVAIHHAISVISHHHGVFTPSRDNFPDFVRRFHRDTSCALNTLLARERYDQPREVFDDRSTHYMRLLDAPAQASALSYHDVNCVAAGLVARPDHMPGSVLDFELWSKGYIDVERPPIYFNDDQELRPQCIRMTVTPPPLLYEAFGGEMDRLRYHMRRMSEDAARTLRAARTREPLGARGVQRLHPWSEPRTLREPGGQRVPTFRIGARGILGWDAHVAAAVETREYRAEHELARVARKAGNHAARFPFGTYAMRVHHGAPVEISPKSTALVTAPGPTLRDVQAQLAAQRELADRSQAQDVQQRSIQLLEEVRAALTDEATQLCEHADLDFDRAHRTSDSSRTRPLPASKQDARTDVGAGVDTAGAPLREGRTEVRTRHRFALRLANAEATDARRVVVLRDRRRGRPRRASKRHGADPPE